MALGVAGILFVLYPAIRPFSDETSLAGAAAFASTAWLVSHTLAMLGFILLTLGLLGLHAALHRTSAERLSLDAVVVTWVGAGLTLPYYGAEAFALNAIGREALRQRSVALVALANQVRTGPWSIMFAVGLVLLGVGTILAAVAIWRSGALARWSGVPAALGFALFIPQFYTPQPVRVAHGLLIAVGCVWMAAEMWRRGR